MSSNLNPDPYRRYVKRRLLQEAENARIRAMYQPTQKGQLEELQKAEQFERSADFDTDFAVF